MKKLIKYFLVILVLIVLALVTGVWCCYRSYMCKHCARHSPPPQTAPAPSEGNSPSDAKKIYICPMHPQVVSDKPGRCPICGMDLVLKETSDHTSSGAANADLIAATGRTSLNIPEGRQQLIGLKKGKITSQEAIQEIRTVGRVAFNTELAVAQREYLESKKLGNQVLIRAAKDRLKILGMNDPEISRLSAVQRALYLPETESWIYPVVYEEDLPNLKIGQKVKVEFSNRKSAEGTVQAIDTILDPMTRSARLHVKLENPGFIIRPEEYVVAKIQIELGRQLLVPKTSVISTGERDLIFVVHEGKHFVPREISLGSELPDAYVVVSGAAEGEEVVTSATFLVDSESRLKAALEATGKVLAGEGHQH